ncbi:MAG: hypothetical protein ACM3JQ_00855 [Candidatus Eiseniibacteriota bacterium]
MALLVGGVTIAPPLRKISDNMLLPDDDKNPTKRRQTLVKYYLTKAAGIRIKK